MYYSEAKKRIIKRDLPDFWIGNYEKYHQLIQKLSKVKIEKLTKTPGGSYVNLISSGKKETLPVRANYNSAVAGGDPRAFMDKQLRDKPVIMILGPVHGHEVEGITGLLNFINILDKGMDLKGRNRKQLKKLAQKCRLLLIPVGNPDGFKRFEPESLKDMEFKDLRFWGQGSWNDGSLCGYPECKLVHPMQKKLTNFLGCYFNDEGINIMHDEFHDPLAAETKAIIELVKEEGPDMILSLHSHEYPPSIIKTNYIPQNILNCLVNFTNKYYNKLSKAGLPENGPVFDSGLSNDKFNLVSFLYHISGAVSAVFENPHSLKDWCQVSLEETLEIQLKLYQTLMEYALERKSGQT